MSIVEKVPSSDFMIKFVFDNVSIQSDSSLKFLIDEYIFDNSDAWNNGEKGIYYALKNELTCVFDVGTRNESLFIDTGYTTHFFEPQKKSLRELKDKVVRKSWISLRELGYAARILEVLKRFKTKIITPLFADKIFNNIGLGEKAGWRVFFSGDESFTSRSITMPRSSQKQNKLYVERGDEYVRSKNIPEIDLLKIDVEGLDFEVIRGFGDEIKKCRIVQFEYGGTWLDAGEKLVDAVAYLEKHGFKHIGYLCRSGFIVGYPFQDNYRYCNVVAFRDEIPFLTTLKKPALIQWKS